MSRIIKNYIYSTSYQLLALIVPLVTAPYLSRVLGAEKLGVYGYVSSMTSIFATVGLLGLYSYGNRETAYIRDDKENLSKTFWEIMMTRFFLLVITSIIFILLASRSNYSSYFSIYYFWLVASFIDISWVFVGLENMKPAVIKNSFSKLATVIGIFVFIKDEADLWIYFVLIASFTLIANVSVYPMLRPHVIRPKINHLNISKFKKHLKESMHLFLPQVATVIYLQIDKVMIENLTGLTRDVGFYLQAEKIINIPLALITGLSTVMMPRIANEFKKGNTSSINRYLMQAAEFTAMIAIPMSIGIAIISPSFVPWFLGNEFSPTVSAIVILSPLIIINALGGISGQQYLTATNQVNLLLRTHVLGALINVALNWILIPKLSFLGAAYASVISLFILVLLQYYYMYKQISITILLNSLLKYLFLSSIMGAIIYLLGVYKFIDTYLFLAQIIFGVSIYSILLILTKDKVIWKIIALLRKKVH